MNEFELRTKRRREKCDLTSYDELKNYEANNNSQGQKEGQEVVERTEAVFRIMFSRVKEMSIDEVKISMGSFCEFI